MIKIIAYDFVGVLVNEKDIELSDLESKFENIFGDNYSDFDYLNIAKKIIEEDSIIIKTTKDLINKLYQIKDKYLFEKVKASYPTIKQIIATNHISYIRDYIKKNFNQKFLDDIIISSEIHKIKPNNNFYNFILNKYKIKPEELLFIDDNKINIESAIELGIQTILVNKNTNLENEIKIKMLL